MKKVKRFLCIGLAAGLTGLLLIGCSKKSMGQKSTESTGSSIKDIVWETDGTVNSDEGAVSSQNGDGETGSLADVIKSNLSWHDSIEEALEDKSFLSYDNYDDHNEVMDNLVYKNERDDSVELFYRVPLNKDHSLPVVCAVVLSYDGNKYSAPYDQRFAMFEEQDKTYSYDILDFTAKEIYGQYLDYDVYMDRKGSHTWFGGWYDRDELEKLRIEGNTVGEIIPVSYEDGKTYYFWYYDKTDLGESMKKVNTSKYTLREIEDALKLSLAD